MWTCASCGSNLLDSTTECPVCANAPPSDDAATATGVLEIDTSSPAAKEEDHTWLMIVIGVLLPPLGLLFLLIYLAKWITPDEES
jgi:hypothetical protein